jgi:hypothetical protein
MSLPPESSSGSVRLRSRHDRDTISQTAPTVPCGAAEQSSEVIANPETPTIVISFWPTMSATRPPNAKDAAVARM